MEYTMTQFARLTTTVEAAGGELTDKLCQSKRYTLTGPVGKSPGRGFVLPACGNRSIFKVPYTDEHGGAGIVELCALCDNLGLAPRFIGALKGGES